MFHFAGIGKDYTMSLAGGMYSPFIQSIYYLVMVTTFICFFLLVMVVM